MLYNMCLVDRNRTLIAVESVDLSELQPPVGLKSISFGQLLYKEDNRLTRLSSPSIWLDNK